MSAKKIHGSSIIGQQGVNLIERLVLGMGFAWYPSGGAFPLLYDRKKVVAATWKRVVLRPEDKQESSS